MRTCKDISKLASESRERELSFGQRMELKFHMMMCSACQAAGKQNEVIRAAIKAFVKIEDHVSDPLSEEAKQRIKQRLKSNDQ